MNELRQAALLPAAVLQRLELEPSLLAGALEVFESGVQPAGEDGRHRREAFADFGFGKLAPNSPDPIVLLVGIPHDEVHGIGFLRGRDREDDQVVQTTSSESNAALPSSRARASSIMVRILNPGRRVLLEGCRIRSRTTLVQISAS